MTYATYDTDTPLGALVAAQRKRKGWTQQRLAERAGVTQVTIARLERGDCDPRLSTVQGIADALGHDTSSFLRFAGL